MHRMLAMVVALALFACDGNGANEAAGSASGGDEASSAPAPRPEEARPSAEAPGSAASVLADLRGRLDRARSSTAGEPVNTGPADVTGVVGTHRGLIESALGPPNECTMQMQTTCPGGGGPCVEELRATPAPCEEDDDVFYSFYHLPDGWLGGGPELLLRYDASGRCTHALWRFTQ